MKKKLKLYAIFLIGILKVQVVRLLQMSLKIWDIKQSTAVQDGYSPR